MGDVIFYYINFLTDRVLTENRFDIFDEFFEQLEQADYSTNIFDEHIMQGIFTDDIVRAIHELDRLVYKLCDNK